MPSATRRTLSEPPLWTNQTLFLYHGTTLKFAQDIRSNGIDLTAGAQKGREGSDFGPGFYTTTSLGQAAVWGNRNTERTGAKAAVLQFSVNREELTSLDLLTFVRWKEDYDDYWSFVFHCRNGGEDHARSKPGKSAFYDVVIGPVAKMWQSRIASDYMDQLSFHTDRGIVALSAAGKPTITQVRL